MNENVIIVDDDRDTREMLQVALELDKYHVRTAANGLELMMMANQDPPDIILLDVMMSWIDGFDLCRSLKENNKLAHVPVVFITGKKLPVDRRRALEAGGAAYFTKPLDLDSLLQTMRELVL